MLDIFITKLYLWRMKKQQEDLRYLAWMHAGEQLGYSICMAINKNRKGLIVNPFVEIPEVLDNINGDIAPEGATIN